MDLSRESAGCAVDLMKYFSTRGNVEPVRFSEALNQGLASDGGLFIPESIPVFESSNFKSTLKVSELAQILMKPWLEKDVLQERLPEICEEAFNFPVPLHFLDHHTALLELFHGPTAAFKDFGARFLAGAVSKLPSSHRRTVLVATSGDTGGAVAAAFFGKPAFDVVILYPKGKVSARQEKQLTSWGQNVKAIAVRGDFDDCQRLVKEGFADQRWKNEKGLFSANSINIGRLLPQCVYYAYSSLKFYQQRGIAPGVIVPTGNLGNAMAALWAKKMGFPIGKVVLATNANRPISEFLKTGVWKPHPTVSTLANAMDVGNPSNIERLIHLYPQHKDLVRDVDSLSVSDKEISETIRNGVKRWGQVFCPHTATAVFKREKLGSGNWIVVATAHPAKFDTIVEPLIGRPVEIPPALQEILSRPSHFKEIAPTLDELKLILAVA